MAEIQFETLISKFEKKGEKSGWTYIEVAEELVQKLMPGQKKSFRVKGKLDEYIFEGIALLPVGEGDFIMALNGDIRKAIKKQQGDMVMVKMEADTKEKPLSEDLLACLEDEPAAFDFFRSLSKGHQRYFSDWITEAKTEATKIKRLTQAINGLVMGWSFPEMIRWHKERKTTL